MKILITGACAVSARNVLRSLKMSKLFGNATFIGCDMCSILYGVYSRDFDKLYKVPAVSSPKYRTVMQSIISSEKPDAVMVIPEVEVLYWAKHPFDVPFMVPEADFCEVAISKRKLFSLLKDTGLVPRSFNVKKSDAFVEGYEPPLPFPMWIRDASAGTASGKGSFMANNMEELRAWMVINSGIDNFQLSEYCPGGNYGVLCLFEKGKLLKLAIAERLEYIMAKVAVSGITGNTSKGRFLNDESIKRNALEAIDIVCKATNTVMNGLVVVDMKADEKGEAKVTEINIRYVAYNCCLASAGFNLAEYHLLAILGRSSELTSEVEMRFPKNNLFLRDVDGTPFYLPNYVPLKTGECVSDNCKVKRIAIYGAGGLGREVAGGIKRINNSSKGEKWELVGFYDDRLEPGTQVSHYGEVLGGMAELNKLKEPLALAIAVGSPSTRKLLFERITNPNISFPNLIAPSFKILDPETFKIGRGNIIQDNCSATCDVTIGDFNVLNGSDILGHDDKIGNFNVIMPGVHLSGDVKIGECNLLGVNSVVLQQIKIGNNVTLGAGSVLMTKPKDGYTYIGTPAKKFDYK